MNKQIKADICVIGGGSGGLSVAAGAAQMGARTVLIEANKMGGDCLNTGCVPSKALIAAGHAAEVVRSAGEFGVNGHEPEIRFKDVHGHVHGVIGAIAPHDSVERFERLGCTVIQARARFVAADALEAGGFTVRARRFVVATGSRAVVPPIPGLRESPHFTNETIFDNTAAPEHLIVIGAGPIGLEMAQSHRRLGARVTVLDLGPILPNDDPELTAVVRKALIDEGVEIFERIKVVKVERKGNGVAITVAYDNDERVIQGSHIMVAAGRKPNVESLGLEAAGIEYSPKGIKVDARLRTTNKKVFAIGDVAGGLQFTHVAAYHAGIVIRNALFRLPAKVDYAAVPWVTYTDPELAHVGLTEKQARDKHGEVRVLRFPYAENDRAQAERRTAGQAKVVVTPKGEILGASLVGLHAGELLQPWVLAIAQKLKIGAMAQMIAPYPTLSEINKRVAGSFYTPTLFSDRTRKVVRFLGMFG
ncbi:MAG TPA: FAD-dependent oxidoreductase [Alphaproteobacteria bacterium]|jgi:pyruvate/2-oxoglutarate dehydrogenase complex dihydrolipoamide dehydrogenase (E3) component|nr:FAD-dependent oxidoreductase [Alphaproteobacteria bacterium]